LTLTAMVAVDYSQDIPGQVIVKVPQGKLFTILTWVDIAIRTSRMSVPPEQAPQLAVGPDRHSLIKPHDARLALMTTRVPLGSLPKPTHAS